MEGAYFMEKSKCFIRAEGFNTPFRAFIQGIKPRMQFHGRTKVPRPSVARSFIAGVLVIVLIFGMMTTGCVTKSHYSVEISSGKGEVESSSGKGEMDRYGRPQTLNTREVFIRNTGTTDWGPNMAWNLQNIDKSKYSARVDIRVVDTDGIVYSKYDVPFDNAAFVVTRKNEEANFAGLFLYSLAPIAVLGILALIVSAARGQN